MSPCQYPNDVFVFGVLFGALSDALPQFLNPSVPLHAQVVHVIEYRHVSSLFLQRLDLDGHCFETIS